MSDVERLAVALAEHYEGPEAWDELSEIMRSLYETYAEAELASLDAACDVISRCG